jgi:hypothetical protein
VVPAGYLSTVVVRCRVTLLPLGPVTTAFAEPLPRVTERVAVRPLGPVTVLFAPDLFIVLFLVAVFPSGPVTRVFTEFFVRSACRVAVLPLGPVTVEFVLTCADEIRQNAAVNRAEAVKVKRFLTLIIVPPRPHTLHFRRQILPIADHQRRYRSRER